MDVARLAAYAAMGSGISGVNQEKRVPLVNEATMKRPPVGTLLTARLFASCIALLTQLTVAQTQVTQGQCSPTIQGVGGNAVVSINCPSMSEEQIARMLEAVKNLPTNEQIDQLNELISQSSHGQLSGGLLSPANEQQNYRRVVTLYHDRYYREAEQLLDTLIKNVVLEKAKFVNDSQKVRLSKYYVLGATIARDKAAHPDFEERTKLEESYAERAFKEFPGDSSALKTGALVSFDWMEDRDALYAYKNLVLDAQKNFSPGNEYSVEDYFYALTLYISEIEHAEDYQRQSKGSFYENAEWALQNIESTTALSLKEGSDFYLLVLEELGRRVFEARLGGNLPNTKIPLARRLSIVYKRGFSVDSDDPYAERKRQLAFYAGALETPSNKSLMEHLNSPAAIRVIKDIGTGRGAFPDVWAPQQQIPTVEVIRLTYLFIANPEIRPKDNPAAWKRMTSFWDFVVQSAPQVHRDAMLARNGELHRCLSEGKACTMRIDQAYYLYSGKPRSIEYIETGRLSSMVGNARKRWEALIPAP
ncbi:hypothetical protein BSFA1_88830 (plasmid) [Burkholderia sp. SFA1]|nr:hypothetical protein BSFA1_88830 [Burkholderia sp. SFA1]